MSVLGGVKLSFCRRTQSLFRRYFIVRLSPTLLDDDPILPIYKQFQLLRNHLMRLEASLYGRDKNEGSGELNDWQTENAERIIASAQFLRVAALSGLSVRRRVSGKSSSGGRGKRSLPSCVGPCLIEPAFSLLSPPDFLLVSTTIALCLSVSLCFSLSLFISLFVFFFVSFFYTLSVCLSFSFTLYHFFLFFPLSACPPSWRHLASFTSQINPSLERNLPYLSLFSLSLLLP